MSKKHTIKSKDEKSLLFLFVVLLFFFCSCGTTGYIGKETIEHQRKIGELENTISRIDLIMSNATERIDTITDRSKSMETEIDTIIREFDEYQRTVDYILSEYRKIKESTSISQ